ncbi:MutS-related protein [Pinibacter aurantiacus]|uniref:DNA mismatch repair protein MutS n=1 Tax=Pinibacter aurantiacus TaxID=2851599 RepID=A0A9E2S4L3_9BACT|nr:DNA mismatch repair protein MutS [Pinibacter aurantiacus]MBV4356528.1 DNA mismatch repair protein MutS [Pinibacter aurantiacus]
MNIDKVTFNDLSIFSHEEEFSLFHKFNFTQTTDGKAWLAKFFSEPFTDIARIRETQQIIKTIIEKEAQWPTQITNGTIMVIEKFYDYGMDPLPDHANMVNAISYKLLHAPDYSLTRYSVTHFADLVKGFMKLVEVFDNSDTPKMLRTFITRAKDLMKPAIIDKLAQIEKDVKLSPVQTVYFGHYLRNRYKSSANELINIFGRIDAWYSMAMAVKKFNLTFPSFIESEQAYLDAKDLYHPLLPTPVSYNVKLDTSNNFLFLTGANMAGKSTFIKAVGSAVYLAHLGMGVPAKNFELSLFDGILSNINVSDNIVKGESYFFNEVQRIKRTIETINNGKKWLVLIDELFKGTNVQDAMKCSSTVIKGLIRIPNSLFILSTHLYEIGEELKVFPNIIFRYFETSVSQDQLVFNYQLKEGISNDRLGYLILKREKVIDLLENIR